MLHNSGHLGTKVPKRLLLAPSNGGCRKTYLFDFKKKYYLPIWFLEKNKYYLLRAFRKHRHIYHVSMFYYTFYWVDWKISNFN